MENDKIVFVSSLLKEKNAEFMQKNLELKQNSDKLKLEVNQLTFGYNKIISEKNEIEEELKSETERWENTISHLKKIINDSDKEKIELEAKLKELKSIAKKNNYNECLILELKSDLAKINEDREIEKLATKEQIETIVEELTQVRHEKEEILSEKLMLDDEIIKYKEKIKNLEIQIEKIKEAEKKKFSYWLTDRTKRRSQINAKQKRIYTPQALEKKTETIKNSNRS